MYTAAGGATAVAGGTAALAFTGAPVVFLVTLAVSLCMAGMLLWRLGRVRADGP
ncbi:MAG TPA: hypothetical protein VMR97_06880 [Acidimicrobiales bacterium]|nr:hypothetical protein [Acidimicrobiales bacterium]